MRDVGRKMGVSLVVLNNLRVIARSREPTTFGTVHGDAAISMLG